MTGICAGLILLSTKLLFAAGVQLFRTYAGSYFTFDVRSIKKKSRFSDGMTIASTFNVSYPSIYEFVPVNEIVYSLNNKVDR